MCLLNFFLFHLAFHQQFYKKLSTVLKVLGNLVNPYFPLVFRVFQVLLFAFQLDLFVFQRLFLNESE